MSSLQVVLTANVSNLGESGEIVKVKAGYARNYLVPRGLAFVANKNNIARVQHEQQLAHERAAKIRAELEEAAKKMKDLRVQVAKEAGPEGKLFGSVTVQDVADALERKGHKVDKKKIKMPEEAIKEVGPYFLELGLGAGVAVKFKLDVTTKRA